MHNNIWIYPNIALARVKHDKSFLHWGVSVYVSVYLWVFHFVSVFVFCMCVLVYVGASKSGQKCEEALPVYLEAQKVP